MTNNDCLRRLRYLLDLDDSAMIRLMSLADCRVTREQICAMLKKDEDPDFESCTNRQLDAFLNGLIIDRRGKKEDAPPQDEKTPDINNNIIFKKLRIGFDLKAEDILAILSLADCRISKHELSAFFRKPASRQYRECKDQILRNFISGLQKKMRADESPWGKIKGAE